VSLILGRISRRNLRLKDRRRKEAVKDLNLGKLPTGAALRFVLSFAAFVLIALWIVGSPLRST
jgi:hypothetical protein